MRLRHYILCVALAVGLPMVAQKKGSAPKVKPFTVVIDAGHGGQDPGAVGSIVQEKKLNLDVSLMLGKMIEEEYPEVRVLLTRKTDVFLTLQERANFVNKNNADLFICIHTNASESREAVGAETFVLGIDKMASNLNVAMRENAVMLLEDNYETTYQGFDPNSIDSYIMFELMQDQYIDRSLQFATLVQQQFSGELKRADRGVRQAGFWVLHKSACPSVLIEMGFISNQQEELYLASKAGKEQITTAIYNAFVGYKNAYDKKNGNLEKAKELRKYNREEAAKDSVKVAKDSVVAAVDTVKAEQTPQSAQPTAPLAHGSSSTDSVKTATPVAQAEKPEPKVDAVTTASPKYEEVADEPSKPVYRVQIFASSRVLKANDPSFKGLKGCKRTKDGNYYKYTYGETEDYDKAVRLQKELKGKFPDCFVVAFVDGVQIPVREARKL
ncbi:MAG: N-acetylmuramoyl-L-alanine amidase [Paludibacteraceae bacterium]|nr:N-acetylmuramoyl-L-alanine amidase [Paludibacteraceae bacterium]